MAITFVNTWMIKRMNSLPPIAEWKRLFVDTSFIIDAVSNLKESSPKYNAVKNAHKLLGYFKLAVTKNNQKITWITSSIVLSELTKFESKDVIDELQKIFYSPDLEIINFTRKEAKLLIDGLEKYIEPKHISTYLKEMKRALANDDIYNPKNVVSNDALIIACAKSKKCDVVLTSDKASFLKIAHQVALPVLLSTDIPLDMYNEIDYNSPIQVDYV